MLLQLVLLIMNSLCLQSPKSSSLFMNLILFSLLILFANPISSQNISFNFENFPPNTHDIVTEGDTFLAERAIQLTKNQQDSTSNQSVGRATYKEPMHLWDNSSRNLADFTTNFTFRLNWGNNYNLRGDGFTFFLAPNGSVLPSDSAGGTLGLVNDTNKFNSTSSPFVAVEIDTYYNSQWDPVQDHIGIDISSVNSTTTAPWYSISADNILVNALIRYDSTSKNLSVFTFINNNSISTDYAISRLNYTIDLRDCLPEWVTFGFSGATGDSVQIQKIISWGFSSSLKVVEKPNATTTPEAVSPNVPDIPSSSSSSKIWLWVVLVFVGASVVVSGLLWFFCWGKRRNRRKEDNQLPPPLMDEELEMGTGPRKFSYKELVDSTNDFEDEGLLGEGGFGRVYKGFLSDINSYVAVKRVTPDSKQGMKEFVSEVKTIRRLRHRNLVQLIGWCCEKYEFLIVYEFMPNKSLDFHLFEEKESLTWEKRYGIALSLASALLYMQEECEQCVLHRDIKSSNVLLDTNFNAKLGDFGLARLVEHDQVSLTTVLIGTVGYMAPEYLESSKASRETDVYSFGIVCLEIASGKKAIGEVEQNGKRLRIKLVDWVWEQYSKGNIFDAVDPKLCQNYVVEQMERLIIVGLACAHPDYALRPSIRHAVEILGFKTQLPVLPMPSEIPVARYPSPQGDIFAILKSSWTSSSGTSGSQNGQTHFSGASFNTDSSKVATSTSSSHGS